VLSEKRIVTKLPLTGIWDDKGLVSEARVRHIDKEEIRDLMRTGTVQFIVANCGEGLRWIPELDRFSFWKRTERSIAKPETPIRLEEFPGQIAYVASEWRGRNGEQLVLLEAHH
jgi:hypothetical protein